MQHENMVTTGQVSKLTGATRSQLRYWEIHGIVRPMLVAHSSRTWRLFHAAEVERIIGLKKMLDEGYTLQGAVRRLDGNAVAVAAELAPVLAGA